MNISAKSPARPVASTKASAPRPSVPAPQTVRSTDTFEAAKANAAGILIGLSQPSAVGVIAPMYSPSTKSSG